nr:hypothetical protein [Flavobacteriales bacterium]
GILYLGGEFTEMGGQARERLAAIDIGTKALTAWSPSANNTVRAIAVSGDSVFIGGNFTQVNGQAQAFLAALNGTSGTLSAWAPVVDGAVLCLLSNASAVYIGGSFTTVNGQTRNRLAAFDAGLGAVNAWNPNAGSQVNQLAWNGPKVLVAGIFPSVGGATRSSLAELDPSSGLATTWLANANAVATAVTSSGGRVFAGGQFTTVNGTARQGMAEVNASSGEVEPWDANITGGVRAIAFDGNLVHAGGFFTSVNGTPHTHLAVLNGTTGVLHPGSPSASSTVNSVIVHQGKLYVAGVFTFVNGSVPRDRFAVFNYCTEQTWFADADEDGLGDASNTTQACEVPAGFVGNSDDCDDTDDGVGVGTTWYFDGDEDDFGDPFNSIMACSPPNGYVEEGIDCNDTDPGIVLGGACDDSDPYTVTDVQTGYPACGCAGQKILLSAKAMLEGPYDPVTGLMNDDLRVAGLLPLTEPYTALGYDFDDQPMAGGDVIDPSVLTVSGPDAIVDWVILELRESSVGTEPRAIRCALIQRDGDIVDLDGISPVRMPQTFTNYRLGIAHRNHMGVVGDLPNGSYFEVTAVDFTHPGLVLFGADPRSASGSVMLLRAGDTSFNDEVIYVGPNNDRDPILSLIGGTVPTAIATGYHREDINMDGVVKYVGSANDRDPILFSIGGTVPTMVRPHVFRRPTF